MGQSDAEMNVVAHLEGELERKALGLLVGAGSLVGGLAVLVVFLLLALVVAIRTSLSGFAVGAPGLDLLPDSAAA